MWVSKESGTIAALGTRKNQILTLCSVPSVSPPPLTSYNDRTTDQLTDEGFRGPVASGPVAGGGGGK